MYIHLIICSYLGLWNLWG